MKNSLTFLVLICALQIRAQSDGDVRLVNGLSGSSGRVEVYYQGLWGTICDIGFSSAAAQVICRNAGFSDARPTHFNAYYFGQPASGRILLVNVGCTGNESNVLHCGHDPIGVIDCRHDDDVGVDCYGQDLGRAGELRNGTGTDGVLVLTYAETSGTVCSDSGWGDEESRVACRMLGYELSGVVPMAVHRSFFGQTSNIPMLMSGVHCQGSESDLSMCRYLGTESRTTRRCAHDNAIAIDCFGGSNLEVTLANGNYTYGQLQFSYYLTSGPLCGYDIGARSLKVYCRMLGYSGSYGVSMGFANHTGAKGFIYNSDCHGTETSILECGHRNSLVLGQCDSALVIACSPGNSTYGRLEVHYKNRWGTVCDDGFNANGAKVFCRMLNQPTENTIVFSLETDRSFPSTPNDPILLDDVLCTGSEAHVNECYHSMFGVHNCMHHEDVWLHCK